MFTGPATPVWSGVTVASGEPFDGIWLRLSATETGTCRLAVSDTAITVGVCRPVFAERNPALVDGDSLAYLSCRRVEQDGQRRHELGATGHGPTAAQLAERLCAQIWAWVTDRAAQPTITAYPTDTPQAVLPPGLVITQQHTRLVLSA
jgi:protein-L-isoaspartate(D-aspartate) O-methyltransferase